MTAQINGLGAAIKNASDGVSQLQTADGALNEVSSMFQRMRELAVLSVNDTYSTTQKTAMNTEFAQLGAEVTRIAQQSPASQCGLFADASAALYQPASGVDVAP
jgi:flagellin